MDRGKPETKATAAESKILNVSFYRFAPISQPRERRDMMRSRVAENSEFASLRGTIIVTPEGINAYFAGPEAAVRHFLDSEIMTIPGFAAITPKESWSSHNPFRKFVIKNKAEAIGLGESGLDPRVETGSYLSPAEFKQWLDQPERDFILVDTRNDYEVELGTFEGAINPKIATFKEFPNWVQQNLESAKDKKIVTFCTGGIRCEKATALMVKQGFRDVYQIDGGILKYLEETQSCKDQNHWQGDCFVFDQRVAVDKDLNPTDRTLCYACWHVLEPDDCADPRTIRGESCPYCFEQVQKRKLEHAKRLEARLAERHARGREKGMRARSAYEAAKARETMNAGPLASLNKPADVGSQATGL